MTSTNDEALIYLRLSDFRDEDGGATFAEREAELREFAAELGLTVPGDGVLIENDLGGNGNGGKSRPASAYKTPKRVTTESGLITFRTNRPRFEEAVLRLQAPGGPAVLIVGDDSRISRNHRDGLDLLDACRVSGASAVAPGEDGEARWILTRGGTHAEVSAFLDRVHDARKYSADVASKVRKGRARWAGKSYHGGRRPYGFRVAEGTTEHHRNLVVDDAEAAVIRDAAADLLDRGVSLKAIARRLRAEGAATVTGAAWTPEALRDTLLKPSTAGLAVRHGALVEAPWPAIVDRDRWDALKAMLTDPARRTTTSNEPRWLLSGFATCGVCGKPLKVGGAGRGRGPAYVGSGECGHVRRSAGDPDNLDGEPRGVDDLIAQLVVGRLSAPDAKALLKPAPRPGADVGKLRAEARELADRKRRQVRMHAAGDLDDEDLAEGSRAIRARLAVIDAQIAASAAGPDPLAEFRGAVPAAEVWRSLDIARRRAVVATLLSSVVIRPAGRRGNRFDPDAVEVTRRA